MSLIVPKEILLATSAENLKRAREKAIVTHDELAFDLANHIRQKSGRLVWTDMQLGPSGSPRPDVYSLEPSFVKFRPMAYEVKVSVADYRRDVTSGKWQTYLPYAAGITFAVPAGLIDKKELPEGCGLMTRSEAGWRTVKAPTLRPINTLPHEAWCKLLIDGLAIEVARSDMENRPRMTADWQAQRQVGKAVGEQVAQILSDRAAAQSYYEDQTRRIRELANGENEMLRRQEKAILDEARAAAQLILEDRQELAVALGLTPEATPRVIRNALREQISRLNRDSEIANLRETLNRVKRELDSALEQPVMRDSEAAC